MLRSVLTVFVLMGLVLSFIGCDRTQRMLAPVSEPGVVTTPVGPQNSEEPEPMSEASEIPSDVSADPSLMLYFSFDELNGNQTIDHSQHQNHGTLVGTPVLAEGKFGQALEFNGESDYVEVPHDESLTVDQSVTVMAWIHTPRHHGPKGMLWQGILAKGNNPRSYSFYTEHGGALHLSVNDFFGSDSEVKVALNEWQHVVAQVDNGVHRYWINGKNAGVHRFTRDDLTIEPDGQTSLPAAADKASVRIGNTHGTAPYFLGRIDEVRIWNRALSEAEILEQMHMGYSGTAANP